MRFRCSGGAVGAFSTDRAFRVEGGGHCRALPSTAGERSGVGVDEKRQIQALERAQGLLKLPNGKALTGFNHDYKRHGTTTLFAALEVTTGLVKAGITRAVGASSSWIS
jgi:hypothetical protein